MGRQNTAIIDALIHSSGVVEISFRYAQKESQHQQIGPAKSNGKVQ